MKLPEKYEKVSLGRIRAICRHYGLMSLWRKIKADPPKKPFQTDG